MLSLPFGCKRLSGNYTRIIFYPKAPLNSKLYIKQLPFNNEKDTVVDSAIIRNNRDSLVLYVPDKVQRPFSLEAKGLRLKFVLINDAALIRVHADYFANSYKIEGSSATNSMRIFQEKQQAKAEETRRINHLMDSLKLKKGREKDYDSTRKQLYKLLGEINTQYINYADTVKSPAVFMLLYNFVDFGDDYKASKRFILKASSRFPDYPPLQAFKKDVLATIKIYEEEFIVGDILPTITLPDITGNLYSTSTIKGKYYLIDFWSTLCEECLIFKAREKVVSDSIPFKKLQIVSVALDDEKDIWKKIVTDSKYNWIQLIDTKMWQGPAARTLVFDSIPFNFLVAPNGKIIKKAIKPDSLIKVISGLKLE